MKEAAVLMSFLRHDPVGQRLGVGVIVMAWFALAWTASRWQSPSQFCSWWLKSFVAAAAKSRSSTTSKTCTRRSRAT